ncbi:hypothetical protein J3B02_002244 [Coemansia erecta]|uniref:Uncharacterized protein n=1 Tax=Coemansia asiatica TaxID=1052880 RepID=A0A9W7XGX4_9FUNG|nr:hypothetical protein LPJ64_005175 [Coemansia asiatica]KAJ2855300.1 hypothetical protein J3B02_002244 [Coemansia erecta]KAJ2885071.1 hypothetical protein FB639_001846 [Coemansia asiatica]
MDEFVSTVENQVFALHPLDTQGAFLNVPYHFFFGNASNAANFMPFDVIRTSFYKALKQFPILCGYLRSEGNGQTSVVVDRSDLNMPEYKESSANTVHISALQECNYHHSSWPAGLSTTGAITRAGSDGRIKLINVHVVRLKENSGVIIFVNIPHYVVDGTGFFSFVELWGTLCRAARTEDHELAEKTSAQKFCFDRAIIAEHLPEDRKPLDSTTMKIYTRFNPLADWLAWLSPGTRAKLLDGAKFSSDVVAHTFRISQDSLNELCKQVAQHLPDEQAPASSSLPPPTHVLAALLSKTVAQAHQKCRQQRSGLLSAVLTPVTSLLFSKETHQSLNLLADMRHPLGLADKSYMGNGLLPHNTQCSLDILESPTDPESLAQVTSTVTKVYHNADAQLVGSFIDLISSRPSCFTRPMVYLAMNPTMVVITNETAFKLYKADFGDGIPEWVCTIPSFVANFVGFLPSPPPSTDIIVNITMKKSVMKHILLNDSWRDIATIVY